MKDKKKTSLWIEGSKKNIESRGNDYTKLFSYSLTKVYGSRESAGRVSFWGFARKKRLCRCIAFAVSLAY